MTLIKMLDGGTKWSKKLGNQRHQQMPLKSKWRSNLRGISWSYKKRQIKDTKHWRYPCRLAIHENSNYLSLHLIIILKVKCQSFYYLNQKMSNHRSIVLPSRLQLPHQTLSPKFLSPLPSNNQMKHNKSQRISQFENPSNHVHINRYQQHGMIPRRSPNSSFEQVNVGNRNNNIYFLNSQKVQQNKISHNNFHNPQIHFIDESLKSTNSIQRMSQIHPNNPVYGQIRSNSIDKSRSFSPNPPVFFKTPQNDRNSKSPPLNNPSTSNLQQKEGSSMRENVINSEYIQFQQQQIRQLPQKKDEKFLTNHIYINEKEHELSDNNEQVNNELNDFQKLSKQLKDTLKNETYQQWKQSKQIEKLNESLSKAQKEDDAVIISRPKQMIMQDDNQPIITEQLTIKSTSKRQDQPKIIKSNKVTKKQQSFDSKDVQIERVRSEVLDEQFLRKLDEQQSLDNQANIPTFKQIKAKESEYENDSTPKIRQKNNVTTSSNQAKLDEQLQKILEESTKKYDNEFDEHYQQQIIIKQQQIEIKKLKNIISMMKLRQNDLQSQLAKYRRESGNKGGRHR